MGMPSVLKSQPRARDSKGKRSCRRAAIRLGRDKSLTSGGNEAVTGSAGRLTTAIRGQLLGSVVRRAHLGRDRHGGHKRAASTHF